MKSPLKPTNKAKLLTALPKHDFADLNGSSTTLDSSSQRYSPLKKSDSSLSLRIKEKLQNSYKEQSHSRKNSPKSKKDSLIVPKVSIDKTSLMKPARSHKNSLDPGVTDLFKDQTTNTGNKKATKAINTQGKDKKEFRELSPTKLFLIAPKNPVTNDENAKDKRLSTSKEVKSRESSPIKKGLAPNKTLQKSPSYSEAALKSYLKKSLDSSSPRKSVEKSLNSPKNVPVFFFHVPIKDSDIAIEQKSRNFTFEQANTKSGLSNHAEITKVDEVQIINKKLGNSQTERDKEPIIENTSIRIKSLAVTTKADQGKFLESPSEPQVRNLILMSSPTERDLPASTDTIVVNTLDDAKLFNGNLEKGSVKKDTEIYNSLEKITSLSITPEIIRERYLELSPKSYKADINLEAIIETENSAVKTDRKSSLDSPAHDQTSKVNTNYTRQYSFSPVIKTRMTNFLLPRSNTNRQNTINSSFEDTSIYQDSKGQEFSFKMTYFKPIDDSKLDEFINNTNITRDQLSPTSPGSPMISSPLKRLSPDPRSRKSWENNLTLPRNTSDANSRELFNPKIKKDVQRTNDYSPKKIFTRSSSTTKLMSSSIRTLKKSSSGIGHNFSPKKSEVDFFKVRRRNETVVQDTHETGEVSSLRGSRRRAGKSLDNLRIHTESQQIDQFNRDSAQVNEDEHAYLKLDKLLQEFKSNNAAVHKDDESTNMTDNASEAGLFNQAPDYPVDKLDLNPDTTKSFKKALLCIREKNR